MNSIYNVFSTTSTSCCVISATWKYIYKLMHFAGRSSNAIPYSMIILERERESNPACCLGKATATTHSCTSSFQVLLLFLFSPSFFLLCNHNMMIIIILTYIMISYCVYKNEYGRYFMRHCSHVTTIMPYHHVQLLIPFSFYMMMMSWSKEKYFWCSAHISTQKKITERERLLKFL